MFSGASLAPLAAAPPPAAGGKGCSSRTGQPAGGGSAVSWGIKSSSVFAGVPYDLAFTQRSPLAFGAILWCVTFPPNVTESINSVELPGRFLTKNFPGGSPAPRIAAASELLIAGWRGTAGILRRQYSAPR